MPDPSVTDNNTGFTGLFFLPQHVFFIPLFQNFVDRILDQRVRYDPQSEDPQDQI